MSFELECDAISIFQGCLLYKHPWKDSTQHGTVKTSVHKMCGNYRENCVKLSLNKIKYFEFYLYFHLYLMQSHLYECHFYCWMISGHQTCFQYEYMFSTGNSHWNFRILQTDAHLLLSEKVWFIEIIHTILIYSD